MYPGDSRQYYSPTGLPTPSIQMPLPELAGGPEPLNSYQEEHYVSQLVQSPTAYPPLHTHDGYPTTFNRSISEPAQFSYVDRRLIGPSGYISGPQMPTGEVCLASYCV